MEQTSEIRALDHVADLMTEAHGLRAEIARLTRERDEAIRERNEAELSRTVLTTERDEAKREADVAMDRLVTERERAVRYRDARDEAIAVAVWAAKYVEAVISANGTRKTVIVSVSCDKPQGVFATDGTDADIYRALKEARNGE